MGRLSTVDHLAQTSLDQLLLIMQILITVYKTSYLNEETNCTDPSPSGSIPWYYSPKTIYDIGQSWRWIERSWTSLSLLSKKLKKSWTFSSLDRFRVDKTTKAKTKNKSNNCDRVFKWFFVPKIVIIYFE